MAVVAPGSCPACRHALVAGLAAWHFRCQACGYEAAALTPAINASALHAQVDEQERESGLRGIRVRNFRRLLAEIRALRGGGTLLDVGCAHGWFLAEAAASGFSVTGIEPDQGVSEATRRRGLEVRQGYFPASLAKDESFDVIVFNDVFEHIPDISGVAAACRDHLKAEGLLVINLPSSRGFFFRLSSLLYRLGIPAFFERMWQKDLPSPHLHYFHEDNLALLLRDQGFVVRTTGSLPAVSLHGLYGRIACAGNRPLLANVVLYLGVASLLPLLKLFPRDIVYVIAERPGGGAVP